MLYLGDLTLNCSLFLFNAWGESSLGQKRDKMDDFIDLIEEKNSII
ncbi:MAG: hypothetical protein JWM14_1676 [Chitinophagaceae bacterium]|nr:hypothetical protein [Chitinophagaceae bacterium]